MREVYVAAPAVRFRYFSQSRSEALAISPAPSTRITNSVDNPSQSIFPLYGLALRLFTEFVLCRIALVRVAFIASGGEVFSDIRSAPAVRVYMIDHRAHAIQKRGITSCPVGIMVGDRCCVSRASDKTLQVLHGWCEDYRAPAPAADPAVATEHLHLKILRDLSAIRFVACCLVHQDQENHSRAGCVSR